ncbi:MAG: TolC family protein [Proteobacteria bacterium]|nr:TolC family protein [Pseudomonadota bacterium]
MGAEKGETVKVRFFLLLAIALMLTANAAAEVRTLTEFYANLDEAATVLKAKADLDAQQSQLHVQEAQKGWEIFGGVSAGYQKSPFAREPFGHFFDPLGRIGVRYPLLGSAERQQRAIDDAATQVKIEGIRLDWSKRLAKLFLEENYAAYWSAKKMLALTEAYLRLRDDGAADILHKRREAGLLFMSDYLEFLSAFDRAERSQIEFSNNRDQALIRLGYLTNARISPFEAVRPELHEIENNTFMDVEQLDLKILQARIDNIQNTKEKENWRGIESDVNATAFGGPAIPHPSPESMQLGYGGSVGFNFRMPLEIMSLRKNEESRLNSQLISLRADYTHRDQELQHEFRALLSSYQQLAQQIKFQHTRLEAAWELIRERNLRLRVMDGDVIEKYFQAVNTYYRIAIENVETESEQWKLHIRLRQFIALLETKGKNPHPEINLNMLMEPLHQAVSFLAGGEKRASAKRINQPAAADTQVSSGRLAAYVWNVDRLIAQPDLWKKNQAIEIDRFLISLNGRQVSRIAENPARLKKFLTDAHRRGKKVELLLGDPDWILPAQRGKLLQLVKKLSNINFDGLHLDIEPDQLVSELSGKARLEELIETVRQVSAISPWPVGFSMHPRYLIKASSFDICLPCELKTEGVKEITVMYYSLNLTNIVAALKSAMQQHPDLTFSLAQSLERELDPENSYAHKPQSIFIDAMKQLQDQLKAANFSGLVIQSWQDLESYLNENTL